MIAMNGEIKSPRVCIIGAGLAGICAGIQVQKKLSSKNFTIYEENSDVGGVWFENTYPGAKADVPGFLYSYSFELNPNWSSTYPPQPEILQYIKDVAKKHSLYDRIKFNHQVKRLVWNESISNWEVTVRDMIADYEFCDTFDIVVVAIGIGFRDPIIPKEFENFKGYKMHSSRWDKDLDLTDKTVAVVGTGASAVQIIPSIVDNVKNLVVYQRSAAWVYPMGPISIPNWMRWCFSRFTWLMIMLRAFVFFGFECSYRFYTKNSILGRIFEQVSIFVIYCQRGVSGQTKADLVPKYRYGCKQLTVSCSYYSAFKKKNIQLVTSKIKEVRSHSIITEDGNEKQLDALVLATGFDVQGYIANNFQIIGKNGVDVNSQWARTGQSLHLGSCSALMPNLFYIIGPTAAAAYTSIIFTIECQVDWIMKMLKEMIHRECTSVEVKEDAEIEHMKRIQSEMQKSVHVTCNHWARDDKGVVFAYSPWSATSIWRHTRRPDFSKYNFK